MKSKFTLVIALALAIFGAGCGKKKNAADPVVAQPAYNPIYNPGYNPAQVGGWEDFKSRVIANQFAPKVYNSELYYYGSYSVSVNSSTCLWIFTCSSSSSSTSSFTREWHTGYISNGLCGSSSGTASCTVEVIRQKLALLFAQVPNAPGYVQQFSSTGYAFATTSGLIYYIDLSKPIVAQPVKRVDTANGSVYQLTNTSGF